MQCPYFNKISFYKIQQREHKEDQCQKELQPEKNLEETLSASQYEDEIPEEGCTSNIKIQIYKKVQNFTNPSLQFEEANDSDKIIKIKMPRTLKIRELNIERKDKPAGINEEKRVREEKKIIGQAATNTSRCQDVQPSQIKDQLNDQQLELSAPRLAKVFNVHQTSFLQHSFFGVIILKKSREHCFCHLDQGALKIMLMDIGSHDQVSKQFAKYKEKSYCSNLPKSKIKYYVDLRKFRLDFTELQDSGLQIAIRLKGGKKQSFKVFFISQKERSTFQCVYMSIIDQKVVCGIKNQSNPVQEISIAPTLKSQNSIDSLKFSVERMRFKEARLILDSFDIVLFKGKNIMSKFQRFFTNSNFDHVGLILKSVTDSLLLFESTGNIGVAVYSFSSIENAIQKDLYQRVAIRKLCQFGETEKMIRAQRLKALQQFVIQANGKKYKFDPRYLISSGLNKSSDPQEETYFCSELVAEALKHCGILKSLKPSYKYLPKHFTEDSLNEEVYENFFYSELILLEK